MSASIVTLRNPQGHALHCIFEEPPGGAVRAQVAAVLLSPGIKTRVGPHQLNRKLARTFLEHGIPVMRVDFRGLGDSEGDWPDDSLEQIYRRIELGQCVGDARAALDWLEARFGVRRFIVGGLCGAAMTALQLAREDERLWALFSIGLPARLVGPPIVTRAELQSHWSRYLVKLARPAAWWRFLTLRSDYRLLWRSIEARLRKRQPAGPPQELAADLNPHLRPAMFDLLESGRTALLLFGEQDPRRWDFEEKFLEPLSASLAPYRRQVTYAVIPGANHILGTPAAVAEANRLTRDWLKALVPQVLVQPAESEVAMLHSGGGAAAIGIHRAALECVIKPMRAPAQRESPPCSANEYSTLIRPPK
jgi:hypothetical protein